MRIVDGGMIAFAAWHALKGRVEWPLAFQVPRMLRKMMSEVDDAWIVCWNSEREWKRELWPWYRDRPEIWDEAGRDDNDAMIAALAALGVVQYRTDGLEADEVLAALAWRFAGVDEVVLVSDDKDFMQLLSPTTRMEGRRRGVVRDVDVKRILGVPPALVADWLALSGDVADGIPKILSPKGAAALLATHGPIRDWIDKADLALSPGTARAIEANRDQIRLNLTLTDLSAEAVAAKGAPGEPILEDWDRAAAAKALAEATDIEWLRADDLDAQFAALIRAGEKARAALSI